MLLEFFNPAGLITHSLTGRASVRQISKTAARVMPGHKCRARPARGAGRGAVGNPKYVSRFRGFPWLRHPCLKEGLPHPRPVPRASCSRHDMQDLARRLERSQWVTSSEFGTDDVINFSSGMDLPAVLPRNAASSLTVRLDFAAGRCVTASAGSARQRQAQNRIGHLILPYEFTGKIPQLDRCEKAFDFQKLRAARQSGPVCSARAKRACRRQRAWFQKQGRRPAKKSRCLFMQRYRLRLGKNCPVPEKMEHDPFLMQRR